MVATLWKPLRLKARSYNFDIVPKCYIVPQIVQRPGFILIDQNFIRTGFEIRKICALLGYFVEATDFMQATLL